jgi:hypothetical protein
VSRDEASPRAAAPGSAVVTLTQSGFVVAVTCRSRALIARPVSPSAAGVSIVAIVTLKAATSVHPLARRVTVTEFERHLSVAVSAAMARQAGPRCSSPVVECAGALSSRPRFRPLFAVLGQCRCCAYRPRRFACAFFIWI